MGRGWVHLRAVIDVLRLPVRCPLLLPASREGPRRRRRRRRARLRRRLVLLLMVVLLLLVRRRQLVVVLLLRWRDVDDGPWRRRGGQLDRDHLSRVGAGWHGDRQLLAAVVHVKLPAAGIMRTRQASAAATLAAKGCVCIVGGEATASPVAQAAHRQEPAPVAGIVLYLIVTP